MPEIHENLYFAIKISGFDRVELIQISIGPPGGTKIMEP
jgi:hypothetical protein